MTSAYIGEELANKIRGRSKINFDEVKEMTIDEMADFLETDVTRPWCTPGFDPCTYLNDPERYGQCHLCALEWLKKEVSE